MGYDKNPYGKPVFDDKYDFPQDSQAAVDFADEFANVRRGTSAERATLPVAKQRPGMLWVETDSPGRVLQTDGAGNWRPPGDIGWRNLILQTGWSAVSGHTPRARRIGEVLYIEGAAQRGAGGSLNAIAKMPPEFIHLGAGSKTVFLGATVAVKGGTSYAYGELYVRYDGVIAVADYTNMDGTVGWVVPLSSSLVHDQR